MAKSKQTERNTLPETNSEFTPENRPGHKRKGSSSNHPFSGAMLASGGKLLMDKILQPHLECRKPMEKKNFVNTGLPT